MARIQSGIPWTSGVDDNTTELADRNETADDELATDAELVDAIDELPELRGGFELDAPDGAYDAHVVDVQEFTTAGNHTWNKPADLLPGSLVRVFMVSGGSGGGSGRKGAEASDRAGGTGGHGGRVAIYEFLASECDTTEAVVVGDGGAGGAARTASSTDGAAGTAGGASTFNGQSTGQSAAPSGGGTSIAFLALPQVPNYCAQPPDPSARPQGLGGSSLVFGVVFTGGSGTDGFAGGGGAGGWRSSANSDAAAAGTGGDGTGGAAGAAGFSGTNPTAGGTSTSGQRGGGGGGGGWKGQTGGAGGWPGGGGGGGGCGVNSVIDSGAGGAGAAGYVRVVTIR